MGKDPVGQHRIVRVRDKERLPIVAELNFNEWYVLIVLFEKKSGDLKGFVRIQSKFSGVLNSAINDVVHERIRCFFYIVGCLAGCFQVFKELLKIERVLVESPQRLLHPVFGYIFPGIKVVVAYFS